jgi:putative phosphoesterase
VRLVLTADTHVPVRARDLPRRLWETIDEADVVIHAGDWVSRDLVDQLKERAASLVGCFGNNDGPAVRAVLPQVARVTLGGLRFVVVHETGAAGGRDRRVAAAYPDADVVVFGHSHIPWDSTVERGYGARPLRILNPGSPTDRRRQPTCTFLTCTLREGRLLDVELHRLPPRSGPDTGPPAHPARRAAGPAHSAERPAPTAPTDTGSKVTGRVR